MGGVARNNFVRRALDALKAMLRFLCALYEFINCVQIVLPKNCSVCMKKNYASSFASIVICAVSAREMMQFALASFAISSNLARSTPGTFPVNSK